jgi:hypothetical protein
MKERFLKLSAAEKISRFQKLVEEVGIVQVWCRKQTFPVNIHLPAFDFKENKLVLKNLEGKKLLPQSHQLYFKFKAGTRDYFFMSAGIQVSEEEVAVSTDGDLFQFEKRNTDRLLCYPHRKVHFFIEEKKSDAKDNVIQFRKNNSTNSKDEETLKNKFRKYQLDMQKSLYGLDSDKNYAQYRVMDLSSKGCSILLSREEREMFESKIIHVANIIADDIRVNVDVKKVAYESEVIDKNFDQLRFLKMGLEFKKEDPGLEQYLNDLLLDHFELLNEVE